MLTTAPAASLFADPSREGLRPFSCRDLPENAATSSTRQTVRRSRASGRRSFSAVDAQSDEEVLVARMVAGDDSALGRVYDRYGGFVYALARRVTGDEGAAGDITQDVFTFLWQHPDRVDFSRGSLRSYLGVVTHRRAVNVCPVPDRAAARASPVS